MKKAYLFSKLIKSQIFINIFGTSAIVPSYKSSNSVRLLFFTKFINFKLCYLKTPKNISVICTCCWEWKIHILHEFLFSLKKINSNICLYLNICTWLNFWNLHPFDPSTNWVKHFNEFYLSCSVFIHSITAVCLEWAFHINWGKLAACLWLAACIILHSFHNF